MRLHGLLACALLAGCGDRDETEPSVPAAAAVHFERTGATVVAQGERLSLVLGCTGCHGEDLTGEDWSEPGFGRLWTANLTRSAELYSDAELTMMITDGVRPDGSELWEMPSHLFTQLSPAEIEALLAFIRSKPAAGEVHPRPSFEEGGRKEVAAGTLKPSPAHVRQEGQEWPPDAGPQHALGRYIVRATCAECHGMTLEGAQPHPSAAPRPDLRAIAPAYDYAAFDRLLRTGKAIGERELGLMSEVAIGRYRHLTDRELRAVHAYLQAAAQQPQP